MRINKKLMTLYPTAEVMLRQREKYSTLKLMAQNIGVSHYALQQHYKKLRLEKEDCKLKRNQHSSLTDDEIMENIRIIIDGQSKNVYTKYMIKNAEIFYKDQRGYEGLSFVGTFQGAKWKSHHMPSAIHRNST